jgi:hypothetical protein
MDLFHALPALRHHPLLRGRNVALVGVSTIPWDDTACFFEIGKPKYWKQCEDGSTVIGIGGIGGSIERGETALACLKREVQEELGTRVRLDVPPRSYLINEWQIAGELNLKPSKKRPTPLMVILVPPQLGGPNTPDHLAILAFRSRLVGTPSPHDLFGLLRVENRILAEFFTRDEWRLEEAQSHPGVTVTLGGQPPPNAILRPILTARAFQLLVRAGKPG